MEKTLAPIAAARGRNRPRVAIVGAGVSGLATGVVLARAGCDAAIFAGKRRRGIASAVAGASWYPYAVSGFRPEWAAETYRVLNEHARVHPACGARRQAAIEYVDAADEAAAACYVDALWWRELDGTELRPADLSGAERTFDFGPGDALGRRTFAAAVEFTTVVARMDDYLPFLEQMFVDAGGRIVEGEWISDLRRHGQAHDCDAVVNCAGFAAEMFADCGRQGGVRPVAGQVIRVIAPQVTRLSVIHSGAFHEAPLYVVPRGPLADGTPGEAILGGSYVPIVADTPRRAAPPEDPTLTERIVRRCLAVEPRLAGLEVLEARVGLRPVADAVQVGADPLNLQRPDDVPVFNNYGHGGGGVSLSWGCASAVAGELLERVGAGAGR